MADSKLGIIIEAKDRASSVLGNVDTAAGKLSGGFATLTKAAGIAGIAMAAVKGTQIAWDLAQVAASAERTRASFDSLAAGMGQNANDMLAAMQRASGGAISNSELVLSANRAMLLGVAKSGEELGQLLEVARARGQAMGLSTAQAFNDLVTGLGRMSPMILDNLGIVTGGEKVFNDYATSIGKTAEQLTDAERKQALFNKVVAESQTMVEEMNRNGDDAAQSFERMNASIQNAKEALGVLFTPAAVAIANKLAEAVDGITNELERSQQAANQNTLWSRGGQLESTAAELQKQIAAMQQAAIGGDVQGLQNAAEQIQFLQHNIVLLGESYNTAAAAMGAPLLDLNELRYGTIAFQEMAPAIDDTTAAVAGLTPAMAALATQIGVLVDRQRDIIGITQSATASLENMFLSAAGDLGAEAALTQWRASTAELDEIVARLNSAGASQDEINFAVAQYVQSQREGLSVLDKTSARVGTISSQFDELKSKVAGFLSGQLDPGVGVNPDDFLPREDAVNEDARRLADVAVNGFSSPWYEYLNNKFPGLFDEAMANSGGNVQQAAAQLLKDFQDGLRPELLDKEAAKERIKKMLLGEANMAQLAQEIAAELSAEMGGQFTPEQIQKATGQALGTDNVTSGVEGTGTAAVDTVVDEIDGAADAINTSGRQAGQNWGLGFLATVGANIPPRLIEILVAIVTPAVWENIQAMTGQTAPEGGT